MLGALRAGRALPRAVRSFTSSAKAAGGHHEPDYVHATHMYDIRSITNRKLKFGLGVGGVVAVGMVIPLFALQWQQARAQG